MNEPFQPPTQLDLPQRDPLAFVRKTIGCVVILFGAFLIVWGAVVFIFSVSKAIEVGTVAAFMRFCGSCLLLVIVGCTICLSGRLVFSKKYAFAALTFFSALVLFVFGAGVLYPFINGRL